MKKFLFSFLFVLVSSFCFGIPVDPVLTDGEKIDYIIITNDYLEPSFQQLALRRHKQGLKSAIFTVDNIYSDYSHVQDSNEPLPGHSPKKIREFLKDMYRNHGLEYAAIGGDVDVVPMRYGYSLHHVDYSAGIDVLGPIASDMYYNSGLSSDTDWIYEGTVTEPDYNCMVDAYRPATTLAKAQEHYNINIKLGRISAETPQEVSDYFHKVVAYESAAAADLSYLEKAVVSGQLAEKNRTLGTACVNGQIQDYTYLPDSVTATTLLGNDNAKYWYMTYFNPCVATSTTFTADGNAVAGEIYADYSSGVNLAFHGGHGWHLGWEAENSGEAANVFNIFDIDACSSGICRYGGVLLNSGCFPGAFDTGASYMTITGPNGEDHNLDCFGEEITKITNGGFVSYIGFSRAEVLGLSLQFQESYVSGFYSDALEEKTAGNLFTMGKQAFVDFEYPYLDREYARGDIMKLNMTGDPACRMHSKIPGQMNVSHTAQVKAGVDYDINISVKDAAGSAVANAMVCLYKENDIYLRARTGAAGSVVFGIVSAGEGTIQVTTVKNGFVQEETEISVVPPATHTHTPAATPSFTLTATQTHTLDTPEPSATATLTATPGQGASIFLNVTTGNSDIITNSIKPDFYLENTGEEPLELSSLKIRYYYSNEGTGSYEEIHIDWSSAGAANIEKEIVTGSFGNGQDSYLEIGFKTEAGSLSPGNGVYVYTRFNNNDWSNYDQSNDRSFKNPLNTLVLRNGEIIWGNPPFGTATITPTNTEKQTPVSTFTPTFSLTIAPDTPTGTNTPENTVIYTSTVTVTATMTVMEETLTATYSQTAQASLTVTTTYTKTPERTPTATITASVPATPTATATTGEENEIVTKYYSYNTAGINNTISVNLRLENTGTTAAGLSGLSVKYWYNSDNTAGNDVFEKDWAAVYPDYRQITSFINGTVEEINKGGQDRVVIISFSSGAGTLEPGGYLECTLRVHRDNWTNYDQSNDYSFGAHSGYTVWDKITVYSASALVWGVEPGGGVVSPADFDGKPSRSVNEPLSRDNVYCFPNPCKGRAVISFSVSEPKKTAIIIFDTRGSIIWKKELNEREVFAGVNKIQWDCRTAYNKNVSNGIYIYRVITQEKVITKKLVIIK